MDLHGYTRLLRRRWRLIVLGPSVLVAAAIAVSLAITPQYEASAQLFVSTSTGSEGNLSGLQQGNQFAQQRVKSYAAIVDSPAVTEYVISELGLDLSPRELAAKIGAAAPPDTVLINVSVRDPDPQLARLIVNTVAARFTTVAPELETPPGASLSPLKVSVVRQADLPESTVWPRYGLNVALALLLGLGIGLALAVFREMTDNTLSDSEELRALLDLPTIGYIEFDQDAARRPLIVEVEPQSHRAEAFRQLRTNLQFVDIDHDPRSIVVTSSIPNEGKSTTACNLAVALAQAGHSVVLVEADLRRPRITDYLGLEGAVGLTDVLVGRCALDDALQPWGDGQLRVLPSGTTAPNPSELLGTEQMGSIIAELEAQADLVLIDAPPLLPVTDAAVVSFHASGALLVVQSGRTTSDQASRAVEILRGVDTHIYGVVLNMIPNQSRDVHGYQYGYHPDPVARV